MNRLSDCKKGDKVRIAKIDAGRGALLNLMSLGLSIGNNIEIGKRSRLQGPVIVIYRNTEIAIGYGLSQKILVEEI